MQTRWICSLDIPFVHLTFHLSIGSTGRVNVQWTFGWTMDPLDPMDILRWRLLYTRKNDLVIEGCWQYFSVLFWTMLFNDLLPTLNNVDNSIVRACSNNIVDGWLTNNAEQHCSDRTNQPDIIHVLYCQLFENMMFEQAKTAMSKQVWPILFQQYSTRLIKQVFCRFIYSLFLNHKCFTFLCTICY